MAFECQGGTDTHLKKNSLDSIDNSCKEIDLNQITSGCNRKNIIADSKTRIATFEKFKQSSEDFPVKGAGSSAESSPLNEILSNLDRTFIDLPSVIISEILNFLDPKELGVVSCVSTSLYRLTSELHVWKEHYCERWGIHIPKAPHILSDEKSWKKLFVEREYQSKTFLGHYRIDGLYGHTEAVRTVFLLSSRKLIFTSGYDSIVRSWDMEEGLSISSSKPLGCTIRAVAADTKLLIAGGTDGFIQGWKAEEGNPNLFDLSNTNNINNNNEFRLWEHVGPITCLALDHSRIYSGSWDMTVRVWDRNTLECSKILLHDDWVWSLVPHDTTIVSTSGSDIYVWDVNSGTTIAVVYKAHKGNTYSLARSHTGNLIFTGGEDGVIHMFEITDRILGKIKWVSTWMPHTGPVYSLAFEFPWLVSASSDGRLSLIDVRKLLKARSGKSLFVHNRDLLIDPNKVEPPQRFLHGSGPNLFSVDIGMDRIVCGGEEDVVRVWNFSEALEFERRRTAAKSIRLENRMRRQKIQTDLSGGGGRSGGKFPSAMAAVKLTQINGKKNDVWNKREVSSTVRG
jgi:WD40 repeat protein